MYPAPCETSEQGISHEHPLKAVFTHVVTNCIPCSCTASGCWRLLSGLPHAPSCFGSVSFHFDKSQHEDSCKLRGEGAPREPPTQGHWGTLTELTVSPLWNIMVLMRPVFQGGSDAQICLCVSGKAPSHMSSAIVAVGAVMDTIITISVFPALGDVHY